MYFVKVLIPFIGVVGVDTVFSNVCRSPAAAETLSGAIALSTPENTETLPLQMENEHCIS